MGANKGTSDNVEWCGADWSPIAGRRQAEFPGRLLAWHENRSRAFPWRQLNDPFLVLLAEIMLQRTQATQAARVFDEFVADFPSAASVVQAGKEEVEKRLSGLGLRHRARRVFVLCEALVDSHAGQVPKEPEALAALPGVGPYTAGAVRSFGFGEDAAIVDRNVVRVLTRIFGFEPKSVRPHTDRELWDLAGSLIPPQQGKAFNYALLDFAALVCTERTDHDGCPLTDICCHFRRAHLAESTSPG